MVDIDFSQYQVKEVIQPEIERDAVDDLMDQIYPILQDRNIPEENKVSLQKQYNELMELKSKKISSGPLPKFVLKKNNTTRE